MAFVLIQHLDPTHSSMMAGLLAVDVSKLPDWHAMQSPAFVGTLLAHFAVVVAAFVGGKLLPADPMPGGGRASDPPAKPVKESV